MASPFFSPISLRNAADAGAYGVGVEIGEKSGLETSFITTLLRPHRKNFNKRIIKSPKIYFLDTGLLCHFLGIESADHLRNHASRGAIFENFVLAELLKNGWNSGFEPEVSFWRDSRGREIDFLVASGSEFIAVEAKSGATVVRDFFKGLKIWDELTGNEENASCLVYGGERSYSHGRFLVHSWACL